MCLCHVMLCFPTPCFTPSSLVFFFILSPCPPFLSLPSFPSSSSSSHSSAPPLLFVIPFPFGHKRRRQASFPVAYRASTLEYTQHLLWYTLGLRLCLLSKVLAEGPALEAGQAFILPQLSTLIPPNFQSLSKSQCIFTKRGIFLESSQLNAVNEVHCKI